MGEVQGDFGGRGEQVCAYEKKKKGNEAMVDDKKSYEVDQEEEKSVEVLYYRS